MTDHPNGTPRHAPEQAPPRRRAAAGRVVLGAILLLICVAAVLTVTMRPAPITEGREVIVEKVISLVRRGGVFDWFGHAELDFVANIIMFVPLGAVVGLLLAKRLRWLGVLLIPAFSTVIELTQAVAMSQRFGSVEDVIANTIGGWGGVLLAVVIRGALRTREWDAVTRADATRPQDDGG